MLNITQTAIVKIFKGDRGVNSVGAFHRNNKLLSVFCTRASVLRRDALAASEFARVPSGCC